MRCCAHLSDTAHVVTNSSCHPVLPRPPTWQQTGWVAHKYKWHACYQHRLRSVSPHSTVVCCAAAATVLVTIAFILHGIMLFVIADPCRWPGQCIQSSHVSPAPALPVTPCGYVHRGWLPRQQDAGPQWKHGAHHPRTQQGAAGRVSNCTVTLHANLWTIIMAPHKRGSSWRCAGHVVLCSVMLCDLT